MDVRTLKVKKPSDDRVFCIPQALKAGYSVEKIHSLTKIDSFVLAQDKNVVDVENKQGETSGKTQLARTRCWKQSNIVFRQADF